MNFLESMRRRGDLWSAADTEEKQKRLLYGWPRGTSENVIYMGGAQMMFASNWNKCGRQVYCLSHSLAAMFALTSAADLDATKLPHGAFLVKIPRQFFPLLHSEIGNGPDTWLAVGQEMTLVIANAESTPHGLIRMPEDGKVCGRHMEETGQYEPELRSSSVLAGRMLANTLAYLSTHREHVTRVNSYSKANKTNSVWNVAAPKDVVINREFREAAVSAVSGTMLGVRRALAHHVRGHWRNQAVGANRAERRLTWIHPHKRGDESLGSVVMRIEKLVAMDAAPP